MLMYVEQQAIYSAIPCQVSGWSVDTLASTVVAIGMHEKKKSGRLDMLLRSATLS